MQATWFSWDWKLSLIKHIWLLLGILLVLTIVIWVGPSPLATSSHESPVKVTPTQQVLGNNSMGMDTKEGPYGNIS